jgi:hypothetical protein
MSKNAHRACAALTRDTQHNLERLTLARGMRLALARGSAAHGSAAHGSAAHGSAARGSEARPRLARLGLNERAARSRPSGREELDATSAPEKDGRLVKVMACERST